MYIYNINELEIRREITQMELICETIKLEML